MEIHDVLWPLSDKEKVVPLLLLEEENSFTDLGKQWLEEVCTRESKAYDHVMTPIHDLIDVG